MTQSASTFTITVPLSIPEHNLAQKHSQLQNNAAKAKQVYLNTLAICAVNFYLNCLSIETSLIDSDSFNPLLLKFMDVADILLPQFGQIECRPVLPDADSLDIPEDVYADRLGYIAVKLDKSLKEAIILGFTTTASASVPLTELRSIEELPAYLHQLKHSADSKSSIAPDQAATQLGNWLKGVIEVGWQTVEQLVEANYFQPVMLRNIGHLETKIKRAKAIDLGVQLGDVAVVLALVLTIQPEAAATNILVQVYPSNGLPYLPSNLQLKMLSESGKVLQETVVSDSLNNYAQLRRFSGQQGDRFSIEITLGEITFVENFVL